MARFPDVALVNYESIRPLIRTGDILLAAGSSPMSQMIREATGSPYSHVGCLIYRADIDRVFIYESIETVGIWNVPASHYLTNYRSTGAGYPGRVWIARDRRIALKTPYDFVRLEQEAGDLCGRAYDTSELALIAWRLMCARVGLPVPQRERNDSFICSEYIEHLFDAIDLAFTSQHPEIIAPGDFADEETVEILWELVIHHGERPSYA